MRSRPGTPTVALRPRARGAAALLVTVLVTVLAGCDGGDPPRAVGDPITSAEAGVLAAALATDRQEGGADFEATAPFAEGTVLTLTGEVDFGTGTGRAQAVTTHPAGQPDDTRTVFFTATDLWQGDLPGLAAALAAAGLPAATYVRRPLATGTADPVPLLDVLVQMVSRLSAPAGDDPASFGGYRWAGSRSVNGTLATVFRSGAGAEVAVAAGSGLLLQYAAPVQDVEVTITLSDHGERAITLPADGDTVQAAAHPELTGALGL